MSIPDDFIDKRIADPMWSDGWYYGYAAARRDLAFLVGELTPLAPELWCDTFDRTVALDRAQVLAVMGEPEP